MQQLNKIHNLQTQNYTLKNTFHCHRCCSVFLFQYFFLYCLLCHRIFRDRFFEFILFLPYGSDWLIDRWGPIDKEALLAVVLFAQELKQKLPLIVSQKELEGLSFFSYRSPTGLCY
jgi:hypothetical protein